MSKLSVLILGHKGMLGHMVLKYLADKCECNVIEHRFPSNEFKEKVSDFKGDYIINCIGAIPQKTKEFSVNYELPIWLCEKTECKVIHPATDYETDLTEYGASKKKASDHIKAKSYNTKMLKTSVIGPETNTSRCLLSWFLNSTGDIRGFKNETWNGITTLEWSKLCWNMMCYWDDFDIENIAQSLCISKYEILCAAKEIYNKNINIIPYENEYINKCLNGNIISKDIKDQLTELKKFYERV